MLDLQDFIKERGGDPEKIRESQRRRHAPIEAVDEVIALWEGTSPPYPPYRVCSQSRKHFKGTNGRG